MKKLIIFSAILFAAFFVSCSEEYDDSALTNRVDNLESRVERLEELCAQMNTNISSLQTIVNALQQKDYITNVAPVSKDGKEVGYAITFSSGKSITIYHGNDGKDGQDGEDGSDGKDGHTPIIGVKQASDGVYYWTVDGEWLLDSEGNKIRAEGKDGLNGGKDGEDGADGITPQLKIENNYWYISYDQGQTWTQLGQATGDKGDPGLGGDSMFTDVDYGNNDYIIFTLSNGTQIKVPTWTAFEKLQLFCNQINTNITAIQAIVDALQENDYIKSVTPIVENGQEIGYTITFGKSMPITILHGKDGTNGSSVDAPKIGVKKDVDGEYYWTIDGEWLTDEAGNKLKVQGGGGADGKDGKDGITPQLKIEDGYWYVSYDEGITWTRLGKAQGEDGQDGNDGMDGRDSNIVSVTQDQNNVYFTLSDGTVIVISKLPTPSGSDFIVFEDMVVKAICCTNWDTNYDNELSYDEAAAVTTIGKAFSENANIVAFTELRYFTKLSKIDRGAFMDCVNLWKVMLPKDIDSIEDYAFYNCKSLKSITIPQSVTAIGKAAFYTNNGVLINVFCKAIVPPSIYYTRYNGIESSNYSTFSYSNDDMKIYVPKESYEDYMQYSSIANQQVSPNNWYIYEKFIVSYDYEE